MGEIRRLTLTRFKQILQRQSPPAFGRHYDPAIRATRTEAPARSRPAQVWSALLQRYIHTLSEAERKVLMIVLYCPWLFELQEQRMLAYLPAPHPLTGHPRAAGLSLPGFRGTLIVAEELGALRHHPVLTVDGPEALTSDGTPMREPACWIGDYLLYLADDNGPFCVNLNVKATAAGFKRSDDTNGSHEDSVIPDPKVELRHTAEAIYYQDAGITTHQVAANTIDDIVVENLKVVMHWATPASRLPEDCRASIVEAFLYGMDGGSPPLEVMRALKLDQGLDEQDIKSAFYRGIYQRKIRVDLFMPVLFDAPLALEKVDVLELYKHWFRRSGS